jgi:predicted nucleotidyltransferase
MYGLPDYTLQTLTSLLKEYPGIQKVVLYGSRATGKYKTGSDIDLTLYTDTEFTYDDLLHLCSGFDDSDIPYFVDVNIYNKISNQNLKAHIDRAGKILYTRS